MHNLILRSDEITEGKATQEILDAFEAAPLTPLQLAAPALLELAIEYECELENVQPPLTLTDGGASQLAKIRALIGPLRQAPAPTLEEALDLLRRVNLDPHGQYRDVAATIRTFLARVPK